MRHSMLLVFFSIVFCSVGCDSSGHDLYFACDEMPTEISLTVDKRIGVEPKSVTGEEGRRSYLIRLDGDGAAVIKSDWVLTRYHRTFILLPERTMLEGDGFEWKGLPTVRPTVKSVGKGSVTSTSTVEGTVYRFAIRETENAK